MDIKQMVVGSLVSRRAFGNNRPLVKSMITETDAFYIFGLQRAKGQNGGLETSVEEHRLIFVTTNTGDRVEGLLAEKIGDHYTYYIALRE